MRIARVAAVFLGLAIVWSSPLARHLSTHLAGSGAGDNVGAIWNYWWMREALASGRSFFFSPYLFAPVGADLTLHTHMALPAFAAATILKPLPILPALNLTIVVGLFLNGFCAHALARRVTGDDAAATVAGLIFAGSPYIAAHLNGHFNLTQAWTIPLFALAAHEAARGSLRWAVATGVVLGATAYVDYYYVVYEIAFLVCAVAFTAVAWSLTLRGSTARSRTLARVFFALALVDVAIIAGIKATGGFDTTIGPIRIQARDVFNALQAFWILVAAGAWFHWRPHLRVARAPDWQPRASGIALAVAAAAILIAAPILWHGVALILRGDYVTQRYFWRSAPKGIDLATLFLANPHHGLWGAPVRHLYERFGIDTIEGGAWLGVAPLLAAAWTVRREWNKPAVRYWLAIAAIFFVWALGPHLMVFGFNTGMILPQTLLRYMPIAANARIPGRASVVVYLALAVLAGIAVASWRRQGRGAGMVIALVLAVAVDYIAAPFPLVGIDRPAIYDTLRAQPADGALLELPVGIRDGLTSRGFLDHRVLAYQTMHRRPIVGGFLSRLPPSVQTAYAADPLIDALLVLSERDARPERPVPDRSQARSLLMANGIAFVMLNRETASPQLVEYVDNVMPLTLVASDGPRSLYAVRTP
jgi:hypothetical protein